MEWIVSLTPAASKRIEDALTSPPAGAAIVELRADLFPGVDVGAAVAACPLPLLVTHRSLAEGGEGPDDPAQRRHLIEAARDAGAAMIDLELRRDAPLIDELGLSPEQCVLSWHDSEGTPNGLPEVAAAMLATRARWVKLVPSAASLADLMAVLDLHRLFNDVPRHRRRLITFAMGTVGVASRHLAPLLGPPLGYASWAEDAAAAPGQLTIAQMEAVISHLKGRPQRLYGVVGADVANSLSPQLHSAAYRHLGLPYLLVPVSAPADDELSMLFAPRGSTAFDAVGLEAWGWAVTTPYKRLAASAADRTAPRVRRADAANTLLLGTSSLTADNTDADGVVGSLVSLGISCPGRTALVQGTGGAARGAAVGLHLAGAEVLLRGRDEAKTARIARQLEIEACAPKDAPASATILVNATPLGRHRDDRLPFRERELDRADAIVDMVYGAHQTALAETARARGISLADGREVLLHQGVAQVAAFTQTLPPREAMRAALASPALLPSSRRDGDGSS